MSNEKLGAEQGLVEMLKRLCITLRNANLPTYAGEAEKALTLAEQAYHARGAGREQVEHWRKRADELLELCKAGNATGPYYFQSEIYRECATVLEGLLEREPGADTVENNRNDTMEYWRSRAITAEQKVLEFHAQIAQLPGADTGTTPPFSEVIDAWQAANHATGSLADMLDSLKEFASVYRAAERGTTPPEGLALERAANWFEERGGKWDAEFIATQLRALAATQRAPVEQGRIASDIPDCWDQKHTVSRDDWRVEADHAREGALRLECDSCGQDVTGEGYRPHRYVICHKPGCADKYTKNTLKLDKAISELERALADGKEGGE